MDQVEQPNYQFNAIQLFALIGGSLMVLMSVGSLFPSTWTPVAMASSRALPALYLNESYGLFLGYFPMNILNKFALLGFGLAGIIIATGHPVGVVLYSRMVFLIFGCLAILGIVPATSTLFGYWPLFGGEIFAHAAFALAGGYFGFIAPLYTTNLSDDYRRAAFGGSGLS